MRRVSSEYKGDSIDIILRSQDEPDVNNKNENQIQQQE